jgi:NAD+ synthase (glutamine-hydrolysing)
MKIALAQINPIVGSFSYNAEKIITILSQAKKQGAELIIFPELAVTGYPPEDLLLLPSFIKAATDSLKKIMQATANITAIVGCVRENPSQGEKNLFNSAAILQNRELIGFQDKMLLPDYDVFSERRYFEPGSHTDVWSLNGKRIGITICEDIWQHAEAVEYSRYQRDPVCDLQSQNPELLINLSASPYYMHRLDVRLHVCRAAARTLNCPVFFCNQIGGNDSLIFDGYSLCMHADGTVFQYAPGFAEAVLHVDTEHSYPQKTIPLNPEKDLYRALVLGIRDYFTKLGWNKACFGLSGGIDSAVVAALAVEALGKENVLSLTMPSRFTAAQSLKDAKSLAERLGIPCKEISIEDPFQAYLGLLKPHFENRKPDITEENIQARIRGMILMAFSNKFGFLLLSSGNKSELAMGYATLYGDMCGGLNVLGDVTKEQVYALAKIINEKREVIPESIIVRAPTAELRADQKDTDSLPEYPIVDKVLQAYVEEHLSPVEIADRNHFSLDLVKGLVRKIHLNEYKRRQAPPGLRVTKKSFTVGRRFPIVQHWNMEI